MRNTHNHKREEKDAKEKWVEGVCLLTTRLLIDLLALGKEGTAIVSLFQNKIYPQIEEIFRNEKWWEFKEPLCSCLN